jgi:hypothetical protein
LTSDCCATFYNTKLRIFLINIFGGITTDC